MASLLLQHLLVMLGSLQTWLQVVSSHGLILAHNLVNYRVSECVLARSSWR